MTKRKLNQKQLPLNFAHPPVRNTFADSSDCSSAENSFSTKFTVSVMPASELPTMLG